MDNKKKGMIFGKINIVDLVIIILILCAGAFVAYRFLGIGNSSYNDAQTVRLTFFSEESPNYVSPNTQVGDLVFDSDKSQALGDMIELRTDEAVSFEFDENGKLCMTSREGYESVYITVEVSGTVTSNGVVVGAVPYLIGHSVVLFAGDGKYFTKVYSIETVDGANE